MLKNRSLANKYRPQKLSDLYGQEISIKFLSYLIKNNINKNIIFKGEYGTGKTTSARIYAKSMLCLNKQNTIDACGQCDSCKVFESSQSHDCLEFDAASKGSIENIRALLDSFNSTPIFSNKKIWIIDEAHSMSSKAWDVLLKTIEEPKEFQIILFCTNYPEKIRPAIISRCITLELKTLSFNDSLNLLNKIKTLESIDIDEKSLNIISHYSKGHSRDLLKNLEQATYLESISENSIKEIFIGDTYNRSYKIIESLCSINFHQNVDTIFYEMHDYKKEYECLLEILLYVKSLSLYGYKMTSLFIDKIFLIDEILILINKIKSYCEVIMINIKEFFNRLDSLILSSSINSIIELKFFIYTFYEKLNIESSTRAQSDQKSTNTRKINKKNSTDIKNIIGEIDLDQDNTNKINSNLCVKNVEETINKIEEKIIEIQPIIYSPIEVNNEIYAHELKDFSFTTAYDFSEFILL